MRRLRALGRGNVRVWWLTHRHEVRVASLFLLLAVLFVAFYEWRLTVEREEKVQAVKALSEERAAHTLPSTVYVLEATTVAKAKEKLARIAGELDVARGSMK